MGLGPEFEDVLSESSADTDDLPENDEALEAADESQDETAGAEATDDKPGRTLENVHREILRKTDDRMSRVERSMADAIDALRAEIRGNRQPSESADPLKNMDVATLRSKRGEVPDEKKEVFDQYLMDRIIEETVEGKISAKMSEVREKEVRREAARKAQRRFPDLRNKDSEFYHAVEARLNERGEGYKRSNPHAVLDVARDVAEDMNIPSSRSRRAPTDQGGTRNTNRRPAPQNVDQELKSLTPPKEEVERVVARLKHAMPNRKFDVPALQKRIAEYRANQHHLRERIRVSRVKD